MTEDRAPNDQTTDEDSFEHGRVGYGAYAKYTPALLALGIVLVIGYIGWMQQKTSTIPRASNVERLGVTYPIGRDTAGADTLVGPVTQAFGVDTFPATVFIDPDGIVSAIVFGPLDEAGASARIDAALEG